MIPPGRSPKLSDCTPLIVTSIALLFLDPTVILPDYGDLIGFIAVSPVIAMLWLAVALWRRLEL